MTFNSSSPARCSKSGGKTATGNHCRFAGSEQTGIRLCLRLLTLGLGSHRIQAFDVCWSTGTSNAFASLLRRWLSATIHDKANRSRLFMYTVSHKSSTPNSHFVSSERIFNFFLLMGREVNFQQNPYNTSHHTFSMSPHYLAKFRSLNLWLLKNNLKIVSHLTKTETSLVIWLNIVTIVARSVRRNCLHFLDILLLWVFFVAGRQPWRQVGCCFRSPVLTARRLV